MQWRRGWLVKLVGAAICAIVATFIVVGIATDGVDLDQVASQGSDADQVSDPVTSRSEYVETGLSASRDDGPGPSAAEEKILTEIQERVVARGVLPCTKPNEPVNFETFSVGPAVAGLPLTGVSRRCDAGVPAAQWPANSVSYSYGDCEIPEGSTGCQAPLVIQTWPACQRSMADYTFEGKPIPSRTIQSDHDARVVEYSFAIESRIEVYTKSATIVVFADDPKLAIEASRLLRPIPKDESPTAHAATLGEGPAEQLDPPDAKSLQGELPCQT